MLALSNPERAEAQPISQIPGIGLEIPEGMKVSEVARHMLAEADRMQIGSPEHDQKMLDFWFVVSNANPENQHAMAHMMRLKAKLSLSRRRD